MSSSIAWRRSPNPGALTAAPASAPRRRFTTIVASASASTSSAMISRGRPSLTTCSSTGSNAFMLLMRLSWIRTSASSSTHSMRSGSVTKYGEM
jgi:hypothetical protein